MDLYRRSDQTSPKSSPRGSRSPAIPRQDSTGTLKTTIALGKNPAIIQKGPFYLMKEPPDEAKLTGNTNLLSYHGLEHSYNKFCGKKIKEELNAFLPNLPGNIDAPGIQDNSSLRSLIEKPPITGKELIPLSGSALAGFRLHPGPLPEQYRLMHQMPPKKHKHKKKRKEETKEGPLQENQDNASEASVEQKTKHKKQKRSDEEREKRKKKKEKKKKKQKHSPEHPGPSTEGSSKIT
ncbi:mediator of RNA polymerase II transcription subunit 19 [Lingula anatina]|uniref:Mediator of RNA polymerase II transcription subunit 19 n=1 Tax=Lingula anatina TaxID=7574 RepID=A0A1S3IYS0_LINAN|nr:mediator of RNA polymerase II transcription subunit 19 [Lingula anatina]|eukprot:XP_013403355.1 mediator of RNA polymerase II transcription subunit 19 [Lingula anatina]